MGPVPDDVDGRLAAARTVLDEVVGPGHDVVVRDGAALLVRRGDVVVRLRSDDDSSIAEREIALATRLRGDGVPAVGTVGGEHLLRLDGFVATCWQWIDAVRVADTDDLGLLARRLREGTAAGGPAGVPTFDPLAHVVDVVGDCGDQPDVCFVRERADVLRADYEAAVGEDPLGRCVVHGDLHAENVVVGADGPLLLDLELGGWGPASYDVAPTAVAVRRYGLSTVRLDAFLESCGADPLRWPGFTVLAQVYELWVTAWAVSVAHRSPTWAAEAELRVATLRDGMDHLWRLS